MTKMWDYNMNSAILCDEEGDYKEVKGSKGEL